MITHPGTRPTGITQTSGKPARHADWATDRRGRDRLDLRRRQTKSLARHILERAAILAPAERHLLEATFHDGLSCALLAAQLGREPRGLRREVRALTRRVLDPRFAFVAALAPRWRPTRRRVAEAVFLRGLSLRKAARELGMSLYSVRLHRDAVQSVFEGARDQIAASSRHAEPDSD
jgi:hypothetical protein